MMGDLPHMQYAGANVNLTITTDSINLMVMESGEIIADHPLHVVSFASGGDVDTLDFVSYVAKDPEYGRACHVLECGGGLAEDVVTTIGQAFELRFKQYLKKQPKAVQLPDRQADNRGFEEEKWGNSEDYYNDNPDAVPPTVGQDTSTSAPAVPPRPEGDVYATVKEEHSESGAAYDNKGPASTSDTADCGTDMKTTPYDNKSDKGASKGGTDAFDMEVFSVDLPTAETKKATRTQFGEMDLRGEEAVAEGELEPVFEEWYHGELSRKQAEAMLEFDGDFLVRKSSNSPGQFVLCGRQKGSPRHLLLVDPEGIVRTREFIFDSVSHLINYHRQNNLPIVTVGSDLQLIRPIKTSLSAI